MVLLGWGGFNFNSLCFLLLFKTINLTKPFSFEQIYQDFWINQQQDIQWNPTNTMVWFAQKKLVSEADLVLFCLTYKEEQPYRFLQDVGTKMVLKELMKKYDVQKNKGYTD